MLEKCPDVIVRAGRRRVTGVLTPQVTDVSLVTRYNSRNELRSGGPPSEDAQVIRTLLEPFWPGRRAHAFDEFCR
jgi:hypothetical protein